MPRSAKTGAGDGEFDAKLRTAIKKKSLIDVQQLLRDTLPRARQTAKKCVLPSAADECLLLAMLMGHDDMIKPLLKIGVNVDAADGTDETALFKAADNGDHALVKLLIQHGADATILGKKAKYPLQVAVEHDDVTTVSLLLDAGANANYTPANSRLQETLLFTAVHRQNAEIAKLLLDAGADANHQNKHGESVLFVAIRCESLPLVQLLLSHGADANYTFIDKKDKAVTTYDLAIKVNKPGIVDALVSHGLKKCDVKTLYSMLVYSSRPEPKRANPKHREKGALYKAACVGSSILVKQLLQCGAKVSSTEGNYENHTAIFPACERSDVEMMKLLLDHGADVNHQSDNCETPLVMLLQSESVHEDAVRLLLDHGAKVSRGKARFGSSIKTPLICSIQNSCSVAVICLLLDRGADLTECCSWHTPVFYAAERGNNDAVRLLIEHGADVNKDEHECTPLFRACESGNIDMVQLLLDHGADVNLGSRKSTPLKLACEKADMELVHLLLRHNNSYSTPLLCAISAGNVDVVRHILNTGADANVSTAGYCNHALKTASFQLLDRPSKNHFKAISEIIALIIGQCNSFEYDKDWMTPKSWFPPEVRPELQWIPRKTIGGRDAHLGYLEDKFLDYPDVISCLLPCLDAELQFSPEHLGLCRLLLCHGVTDKFSSIFKLIHSHCVMDDHERKEQAKSRARREPQPSSRVLRKRKPMAEPGANSKPVESDASSMPVAEPDAASRPVSESDALSRSFVRAMILAGVDFSGLDALEIDTNIPAYIKVDEDLKEYADYLAMVKKEVELMPSLQDRCVVAVWKYLCGGHVYAKVESLPLPKPLQDLLKLTNV